MKALKTVALTALCALCAVSICACKKEAAPEAPLTEPTAEPTATPEPTKAPDTFDFVIASPTPEPVKAETLMKGFIISEADVDAVMTEDVAAWKGWSVVPVSYDGGRTDYYVIPAENEKDTEKAAGVVIVTLNENNVDSISCRVFPGKDEVDQEGVKTLYAFFKDTFPFEVVSGLTKEAWEATQNEVDMSWENASEQAANGTDTRAIIGSFVFHTSKELVSMDFYMK